MKKILPVVTKNVLVVATIVFVWALLKLTPIVYGGFAGPSRDGYWYNCYTWGPDSGCYYVTPFLPRFSEGEQVFFEKLRSIPRPPEHVPKGDFIALFGKEPDFTIDHEPSDGAYRWDNIGPGTDPLRHVTINTYRGQVSSINWQYPGRFFLNVAY